MQRTPLVKILDRLQQIGPTTSPCLNHYILTKKERDGRQLMIRFSLAQRLSQIPSMKTIGQYPFKPRLRNLYFRPNIGLFQEPPWPATWATAQNDHLMRNGNWGKLSHSVFHNLSTINFLDSLPPN